MEASTHDAALAFHTNNMIAAELARIDAHLDTVCRLAIDGCRLAGVDPYGEQTDFHVVLTMARRAVCELTQISSEYERRLVLGLRDPRNVADDYA